MRRAFLLALAALAAPAAAPAQTTALPPITFTEGSNDITHGKWISLAECLASKANPPPIDGTDQVKLSWVLSTFPAGGDYKLFASTGDIAGPKCPTAGGTNPNFEAGQVTSSLGNLGTSVTLQPVKFADIFAAVKVDCTAQNGDLVINICAQAYNSSGAEAGIATGKLTLSTSAPGAPPFANASPADDGALQIDWGRPNSSPPAADYVITATGRTIDTTPHSAGDLVTLSYVMKGLVNGVTYDISVVARSAAGNPGPAATTFATVVPVSNFWDVYHDAPPDGFGGREKGGCSAGAAGPVALLGVAALLAAIRRRS
jgi:hypothetical protein